jgi:hypothetical protein
MLQLTSINKATDYRVGYFFRRWIFRWCGVHGRHTPIGHSIAIDRKTNSHCEPHLYDEHYFFPCWQNGSMAKALLTY